MQYFVAPSRPGHQTAQSLRARQYKVNRKRKHDEDEEPPISPDHDLNSPNTSPDVRSQRSFAAFSAVERAQLRVAGLLPEDGVEIPPAPFPHANAADSTERITQTHVRKELAELNPPLYTLPNSSRNQAARQGIDDSTTQKQLHLNILTTILHRSLLKGDYLRAGRAWGMILRSPISGRPMDLRAHGRWGLGAEILLHRNFEQQGSPALLHDASSDDRRELFSEEGFRFAREYYERLIVEHPHRKSKPNAIDETVFYPAMFSLWIYEVSENSKRARHCLQEESDRSVLESDSEDDTDMKSDDVRKRQAQIRLDELNRAREIAERLDSLIMSPPFDKHADLLQLRGMVSLWIGDLLLGEDPKSEEAGDPDRKLESGDTEATETRKHEEVLNAHRLFTRAKENGARLWKGIVDI